MFSQLTSFLLAPAFARRRLQLAFGLYFAILAIGSIPGARAEIANLASGLILHATAYAGICLLLCTGYAGASARRAFKAVLTVALMGAIDEFIQSFLPYRHGAVSDWLVDVSAAVLMAALLWAFLPRTVGARAPR